MEDMDVPDIIYDVFLHQGRYPEDFMLISQSEVCQEGEIGGSSGFVIRYMVEMVTPHPTTLPQFQDTPAMMSHYNKRTIQHLCQPQRRQRPSRAKRRHGNKSQTKARPN